MGEEKNIIGQLFINGQPLTVIKEVEFTVDDFPSTTVINPEPAEISFEGEVSEDSIAALKEIFADAELAYKLMATAVIATWLWKSRCRRRYRSHPRTQNRTRRKQRLTRLQRRRKRQNKSKTKRR